MPCTLLNKAFPSTGPLLQARAAKLARCLRGKRPGLLLRIRGSCWRATAVVLAVLALLGDRRRQTGSARPRSTYPARRPRGPTTCSASTSAARRRSRSSSAARRRRSTARGRSWSAPCGRSDPRITTLSPWDRGSVGPLRPGPRRALIVVDFHVGLADSVNNSVDELDAILAERDHAAGHAPPRPATRPSRGRSRTSRSRPPSAAS